jgi:hypothetical protein
MKQHQQEELKKIQKELFDIFYRIAAIRNTLPFYNPTGVYLKALLAAIEEALNVISFLSRKNESLVDDKSTTRGFGSIVRVKQVSNE